MHVQSCLILDQAETSVAPPDAGADSANTVRECGFYNRANLPTKKTSIWVGTLPGGISELW